MDFQGARQIWNEQAQRLSILIPFVGDNSPFGVTVNLAPVFYWFGEHDRRIASVSYGGFTTVQAQAGRVYPQSVNIAAAQQENVIYSSVVIMPTGGLGGAQMVVASRTNKTFINSFSTSGNVSNQTQMRAIFNPKLSLQALVITECALASEPNPRNLPICPVTAKDNEYSVPPSGTPVPAVPEISNSPKIDCAALGKSLQEAYRDLSLATRQYAFNIASLALLCAAGFVGGLATPPPWNIAIVALTAAGCGFGLAALSIQRELLDIQSQRYREKFNEYGRLCS